MGPFNVVKGLYTTGFAVLVYGSWYGSSWKSETIEKIKVLCPTISPFKEISVEDFQKLTSECQHLIKDYLLADNFAYKMTLCTVIFGALLLYRYR